MKNSSLTTKPQTVAEAPVALLGLPFERLTAEEISHWIGSALYSPSRNTLLFMDAQAADKVSNSATIIQFIRRSAIVVPKGRGLNMSINLLNKKAKDEVNQDSLYESILDELEHRGAAVCLVSETEAEAKNMIKQLATAYPKLSVSAVIASENRLKTEPVAICKEINHVGATCLISALGSPLQEYFLSLLSRRIEAKLRIGLGNTLDAALEALIQKRSGLVAKSLKRHRFSILRSPVKTVSYLLSLTGLKRTKKRTVSTGRLNVALTNRQIAIRISRVSLAAKSQLWQMRCNMQRIFKRVTDFIGAGIGLLCLSPLLLTVMLIIKLSSPGPIFYSQIRVGLKGKTFRMWKFRSMYVDADARKAALEAQNEVSGGVIFKMKNDPRITPIGRIIRRLSIDELPQLFNVLKGDMSLVGPRPALEKEVAQYPVLARARLEAIPGLTGLWQISGRSDLPFDKQILLDTTYVHTQSAVNDIILIAKTIPAVVSGKGAY